MKFMNVVSTNIVSYDKYFIIREYETKEEALKNYKTDVEKWIKENRNKMWYKINYPFAFATIKEN